MAEFVFKDMVAKRGLTDRFHIESCATSREEIGNPVYPPAKRKLAEHNISCEGKRARQITKQDYEEFDYIIAMARSVFCASRMRRVGRGRSFVMRGFGQWAMAMN